MIDEITALPPYLRKRLTEALETGMLVPPYTPFAIRAALGGREREKEILGALREWERLGVSGEAAAAWLRSLDKASSRVSPPSLVWTGPPARGIYSRDTRQVFAELVEGAKRSIVISSYAYFDGPEAFKILAGKMDRDPSVEVTLLLNIDRRRQRTTATEALVHAFAERFWQSDWPGKAKPSVYYDPRSLDTEGPRGVLHAKAVVADQETLFVISANLTEAAFDRNIEMGVLLRDRAIARTAFIHFQRLIEQGYLRPLPSA